MGGGGVTGEGESSMREGLEKKRVGNVCGKLFKAATREMKRERALRTVMEYWKVREKLALKFFGFLLSLSLWVVPSAIRLIMMVDNLKKKKLSKFTLCTLLITFFFFFFFGYCFLIKKY